MGKKGPKLSTVDKELVATDEKIEGVVEPVVDPYVARRDATVQAFIEAKKKMPTAADYVRASIDVRHILAKAGFDNSDVACIFAMCSSQMVFDQIQLFDRLKGQAGELEGMGNEAM